MGQSTLARLGLQTLTYDRLATSAPSKDYVLNELTDRDTPTPIPY